MAATHPSLSGPYLEPQLGPRPDSDSDSDSDGPVSSSSRPSTSHPAGSQVIHSGHFMVSSPHSDLVPRRRHQWSKPEPPCLPSIDPTLTRLFECMSLAYSGKLVSPKWKNFKGLRLLCRDKIRLNNAIWRAWYFQYVERRKSPVCGFVTPLDGSEADEHRKPEAVVLEGKYWKRRIEVVMKEYHKWRIYHKKRLRRFSREGEIPSPKPEDGAWRSSENWCDQLFSNVVPMLLRDQEDVAVGRQLFDLDSFLSDISDTLFTMTQASCAPQKPEDAYIGNADMIQPDLAPLQPNVDDFMEISDFFATPWTLPAPTSLSYQEQPCFVPVPETLYSGSSSNPLTDPVSPPIRPSTHLQPAGGCSAQHGPRGTFLSSDLPPALPPSSSASSLDSHPRQKPPLPYTVPGKWLSLDPYSPRCSTPQPGLPLLNQDPHSKLQYPPSPVFSRPPSPALLATAPFSQSVPMPGYGGDLSSGYPPPYSAPHVHTGMPGAPTFGTHRCHPPPGSSSRPKARGGGTRTPRARGLPTPPPPLAMPACLTQLLTTAKPKPTLEARPAPSHALVLTLPRSMEEGFCEEPARAPPFSPQMSPLQPIPATPPEGALLVPKTERVSPTLICASSRRMSGQGSPASTEGPGTKISPPPCNSSRPESSKVETRRITHISAEQKRRFNIKLGFDTLHSLVSTLSAQPSLKVSKATTLQKTAEYICKLQQERVALQEEAQRLRDQIEELNITINLCQQQLPATGVPITRQRFAQMREMFDEYVRACTLQNWKFWVFSILIRPLFESFNGMVSTTSMESLSQTSLAWLDEYCSLPALRPTVLSSLRQLSVSTSILTNPAGIPEQATQAVTGADPKNSPS
ncbi:carbohydrate-responsive element-binding protein [Tiliqua scincoides]|uniref:carbohydrate-responsive element-binding protein n=1 Tax=Tiliqua scincoides TaxID=71010 RepID=UPI003461EDD9